MRVRRLGWILAAMDTRPAVLELRLQLEPPEADAAGSPAGWLRRAGGPARRFEGYVQLISILDELYHGDTKPRSVETP
jgi:hypothetical protein